MTAILSVLLGALAIASASPLEVRAVTALNQEAFEEAQQRDETATRAFSATEIKTSDGQCLVVDELSGDFRANLTPITAAACDGSTGQLWDIITSGKHNDKAGTMLVVNTLTQACLNFDSRRAKGNTVIMFSCGGRADGDGAVTNSQQFAFDGAAGPLSFEPQNAIGTCFALTAAGILDEAPCDAGDATQSFTFGGEAAAAPSPVAASSDAVVSSADTVQTVAPVVADATTAGSSKCTSTTMKTVTRAPTAADTAATSSAPAAAPAVTSAVQQADANPTVAVPVSRAGGVLNPSAAAEANRRDDTATRAISSASIKSSTGKCLFIDPTAGDFRQNLIPIGVQECTGGAGEKFDLLTAGEHNDQAGSTLVVSSLMQGCLNFDDRRAAGDTVIMFSCGGRADGESGTATSQLFKFDGGNTIVLSPENSNGATCMFDNAGKLDSTACTGDASQVFTIEA